MWVGLGYRLDELILVVRQTQAVTVDPLRFRVVYKDDRNISIFGRLPRLVRLVSVVDGNAISCSIGDSLERSDDIWCSHRRTATSNNDGCLLGIGTDDRNRLDLTGIER